jgi:hypothetical protein
LNQFVFNHPLVLFSSLVPRDFYTLTVVCGSHKVKDSKLATIFHRKDVVQVVIPFGWLFLIDGLVFHSGQESDGINSQTRLHAHILHKDMKLSDYRLPEERRYFAEGVKYCDVNTFGCSKCSTHLKSLDNKIIRDDEVFNVLVPFQESAVLNGSGTALVVDLVNYGFCWIRVALSIPSQPFSSHLKEFCRAANNWESLTCGNIIYEVKTPDSKRHQNCMHCDIKATKTYIDSFMSEQDHKSVRLQGYSWVLKQISIYFEHMLETLKRDLLREDLAKFENTNPGIMYRTAPAQSLWRQKFINKTISPNEEGDER